MHSIPPRDPPAFDQAALRLASDLVAHGHTADSPAAPPEEVLVGAAVGRIPGADSVHAAGMDRIGSADTWFASVAGRWNSDKDSA